jgi:ribosome maturation factor RimP
MDLQALVARTLNGLGYELVDLEWSGRGMMRLFIDKTGGINVDDCALVSHQLTRLFEVENVPYERLEVSSPGLDRVLRSERDFARFAGEQARVRVRIPVNGQRNFTGRLGTVADGALSLEVDGATISLDLANLEKVRLVPNI